MYSFENIDIALFNMDEEATYNIKQRAVDKLTKLSKITFTIEFWNFLPKNGKIWHFGWSARYSPSDPSISGIFLKFSNLLRS